MQCMCLVRLYGSIRSDTHLLSRFLLSYDRSFAREWINTSLNYQALTLEPDPFFSVYWVLFVFLRGKRAGAPT
jgi:hypothetical protein